MTPSVPSKPTDLKATMTSGAQPNGAAKSQLTLMKEALELRPKLEARIKELEAILNEQAEELDEVEGVRDELAAAKATITGLQNKINLTQASADQDHAGATLAQKKLRHAVEGMNYALGVMQVLEAAHPQINGVTAKLRECIAKTSE